MRRPARRHRVVVATALHDEALSRLAALFEIDVRTTASDAGPLQDVSGLMVSQHTELAPAFLRGLPRLQAIGLTGAGAGLIDLQAMTEAGIRVTHAPLDDAGLLARSLFRMLERSLNEQARERDGSDPTPPDQGSRYRAQGEAVASLRPLAPPGRAPHETALRLALVGSDDITARMLALAREAGYRCVGEDSLAAGTPTPGRHSDSDVRVMVTSDADRHRPPPGHQRLIDLRATRRRYGNPESMRALRDQLAVDGLIAAMGMGRDSFHPRFLLNPEVCPLSCC